MNDQNGRRRIFCMNGVFNYNPISQGSTGTTQKGMVSWSGVLVAMAISLFIVAGLSFTLNIVTQKVTQAKVPDSDNLVYSWLAKAGSTHTADAVTTQYSSLDRTLYYSNNKNAYTGKGLNYLISTKVNTKTSTTKKVAVQPVKVATKTTAVLASSTTNSLVKATRLIQSASIVSLAKKGNTNITIGFKNIGTTVWPSQGLTLQSSASRGSYLSHSSWVSTTVVKNTIQNAKPGELIYVTFTVEAPDTIGTYKDTVSLNYGGQIIDGTQTPITVVVVNGTPDTQISSKIIPSVTKVSTIETVNPTPSVDTTSGTFNAIKLIQSAVTLTIGQLQSADFQIGWKNTGTATWKAGDAPIRVRSSARTESYFHHSTWDDGIWVTTLKSDVKPGEVVYTPFKLEAPTVLGSYNETFTLYRGATPLSSAQVALPIQVIKGAPKVQIAQEGTPTPIIDTPVTTVPVLATTARFMEDSKTM